MANNMTNLRPQAEDWDHFWSLDQTKRFTQISCSKQRIMTVLDPFIKPGKSVLDAGCGSGFFSQYFADRGAQTVALDYSSEALEIVKRLTQGRVEAWQKDLLSPDFSTSIDRKFDVIFSDGLLEHFSGEEQNRILTNLRSVLKSDGVIVTFVPNQWSPWQIIRPFYMPGIKETPFILSQLDSLHERNGLKVIRSGGVNVLPIKCSPEKLFGKKWGMLLFVIARP
ncbi:MAG: class I SAM-dependent methyltransferase [Candidatus Omnitrophica bacterium]|nr:class I SAM-dependent methyltransferase [Candidatus Omnitrophota bacterium]